ncbi:DUF4232 domain-containing protein [Streptomyces sp. NPDC056883]|uniref:DUF4232 domain-containing protein n=1 Tax=Streptomyces sp. NPDC056883 TaxID=3345959 RepID=UPI0036BD72C8
MRTYRLRTTALATVTAGLALALTACGGSNSADGPAANPTATNTADKPVSTGTVTPSGEGASATPSDGKATGTGTSTTVTPAKAGPGAKNTGDTTGDAYAYTHPCSARNLTVKVTSPAGTPATVRIITVTNNGSTSCGLDYFPTVGFSAKGSALGLQATAPGGLGGAPAYPVRPGATAYAAVNLNPSGANGPVADEINVLADQEHMSNADGVSLRLTKPGSVANPKVGLYRTTTRDALTAF